MHSTPLAEQQAAMIGGVNSGSVTLSRKEIKNLCRVYDTQHDENELIAARNVTSGLRLAQRDGMRMVAWLSEYLEAGEDPVKMLVRLVMETGYDVDPEDAAWAEEA